MFHNNRKNYLFVVLMFLTSLSLFAQRPGDRHRQSQGDVSVRVGNYYDNYKTLKVVKTLQIKDLIQRGIVPQQILVSASTVLRSASAYLLINNQRVGRLQTLNQMKQQLLFPIPKDRVIRSIQIQFFGQVYVERLTAKFKSSQRIMAQVNQAYRGQNTLKVKAILKRQTNKVVVGKKLVKVFLRASSARGHGQASLIINGKQVGYSQTVGTRSELIKFELDYDLLRNIIVSRRGGNGPGPGRGRDRTFATLIESIQIDLRGAIYVEKVGIKVEDLGRRGPQIPPRGPQIPPRGPQVPPRGPRVPPRGPRGPGRGNRV